MSNGFIAHLSQKIKKIREFIKGITAQSLWAGQDKNMKPDNDSVYSNDLMGKSP
jgi:hypothetical protein